MNQSQKYPDGGRLAGTIGPEKSGQSLLPNQQIDSVQYFRIAIGLSQSGNFNDVQITVS